MDALQPEYRRLSTRARPVVWLLLTGAVLWSASAAVQACRCAGEPSDTAAYRQAWAVVHGTVQQVQGDPYGPGGVTVTVVPTAAWKRNLPAATLTVRTSSTCAFEMHAGEGVLLYLQHAGNDPQSGFSTQQCMGNQRGAQAESASQRLQRHGKEAQLLP